MTKPTSSRIFRYIWRINAVLILGVGVMGMLALIWIMGQGFGSPRHATGVVNVAPDRPTKEEWHYSGFREVEGTPYQIMAISSQQIVAGSYEKKANSARNLMFYDSSQRKPYLMLPDNNSLILEYKFIKDISNEKGTIKWMQIEVVSADTDKDGQLTRADKKTLALCDASGLNFTPVIKDIDEFYGFSRINENILAVFYRDATGFYAAEIDLPNKQLAQRTALPNLSNK